MESEAIIRFVLVGNGGTGKSTTGNTILGAKKFVVSRGLSMETSKCEMHRGTVLGETVEVVDTPDLSSTSEKQIGEALAQAAACMPSGPHAFLFLLSLSRRFTKGEVAAYQRLIALFDEFVTKYMIVVFTGGDDLGPECTINDILVKAPPDLRSILETCDNRYVVFNNESEDRGQVRCLLDVARDLMQHNGNQCYSWPRYFSFHDKTQEEISKRIAIVTNLESKSMKHFKQLQDEIKILEEKERSVSEKREEERENKVKGFQFCLQGTFQKRKQKDEKLKLSDLSLGLSSMFKLYD
ncbi:immune-associated nucleotide-binding protein 1-like isoform X2 [Pomacea canaliculata]|uniref:immune-associated nucleotide-binding protein 1-like isoform X2 n=1 Tax=Pomacea canaliculata TaxID=400727 RepID=UPI000D734441|nr:immune-associated nucleotide-binding protein 1-like isoform X2 [Pomacea canaliculata]